MEGGAAECRHVLRERCLDSLNDAARCVDRQLRVGVDVQVSMHLVPHPARPHLMYLLDPIGVQRRLLHLGRDVWLDPVEEPSEDCSTGVLDDDQDREHDQQSVKRTAPRKLSPPLERREPSRRCWRDAG